MVRRADAGLLQPPASSAEQGLFAAIKSVFALKPIGRRELVGIQYIRGLAALMVVLDHISEGMGMPKYLGHHPFGALFESGKVGVDLFFCVSGFIIVYIALDDAWAPKSGPWVFIKRRFARIVPFLWLVIAAYALVRIAGRGYFPVMDYVRAAVIWPFGVVAPSPVWTLRHEILFYGVFAMTMLSGRRWLLVAWVLSPLVLLSVQHLVGPYDGLGPQIAYFLFNPIDLMFGLGVVFGLAYLRYRESWPRGWWAAPTTVAGAVVVFCLAGLINLQQGLLWRAVAVGVAGCVTVAAACAVSAPRGPLGALGRRLGDASYCIYLTHVAFVSAVLGFISHHARGLPDVLVIAVTLLVATAFGLILHYVVELPVVAWSQRLVFRNEGEGR